MKQPNREQLLSAIKHLASKMGIVNLDKCQGNTIIEHVLFDGLIDDLPGKKAWRCLELGILTEREVRNLLIAHTVSQLEAWNLIQTPEFKSYNKQELIEKFEYALYGRVANKTDQDISDSWET